MAISEIILYNSGKVGLDFTTNLETSSDEREPGKIAVIPARGHVKALQRQNIVIKYLPGIPTKFKRGFMVSSEPLISSSECLFVYYVEQNGKAIIPGLWAKNKLGLLFVFSGYNVCYLLV